jgi:tripartite ATP-independent transporter DctP family solute receptor
MFKKLIIISFLIIMTIGLLNISSLAQEPKVLKLAHGGSVQSVAHLGYTKFKELVEERTKGEVKIDIFPGGVLSGGGLSAFQTGNVEMGIAIGSELMDYDPRWGIFEMPFLFLNYAAVDKILNGNLMKSLFGEVKGANVVLLTGWFENGYRQITNNIRPIHTVADLKGIKIRVMATPLQTAIFSALGASPMAISYEEMYSALQTGVVDAEENPPVNIKDKSLYEVQKYLSLTGHSYYGWPTAINAAVYNSFSPEIQKILNDSMMEASIYEINLMREANEKDINFLKEKGMIINDLTTEEKMTFVEATKSVYDKFADKIGKDFINQFMEEMGRKPLY